MPNSAALSKDLMPKTDAAPIVYEDRLQTNVNIGSGLFLPRLAFDIYQSRADLQQGFPNPFSYYRSSNQGTFYDWVTRHGVFEYPALENFFRMYLQRENCEIREMETDESLSVAIIVPSLNRREQMLPMLRSVAAQSYRNWKLYLVDEAEDSVSRDFARGIVGYGRLVCLTVPGKKQGIFEENVARARNFGMRESIEPLIAHLDDDNLWDQHHLRKLVDPFLENSELGMTFALHRCLDATTGKMTVDRARVNSSLPLYSWDALRHGNFIASDDVVMRRELLTDVGFFREDLPYYADWEYWLRIAAAYPVQQVYEMLSDYLIHEASITERLGDADFKLTCESEVRQTGARLSQN